MSRGIILLAFAAAVFAQDFGRVSEPTNEQNNNNYSLSGKVEEVEPSPNNIFLPLPLLSNV
jgi:hypothetical protein